MSRRIITKKRTTNKNDMIAFIMQKTNIKKSDISKVIDSLLKFVEASLIKKEAVFLRGIGTFVPKVRDAQPFYNIFAKERQISPPRRVITFSCSKKLRANLSPVTDAEKARLRAAPVKKSKEEKANSKIS